MISIVMLAVERPHLKFLSHPATAEIVGTAPLTMCINTHDQFAAMKSVTSASFLLQNFIVIWPSH